MPIEQRLKPGLLFTISPCRAKPSHLFGTIHSDDPTLLKENADVVAAMDRSSVALFELVETPDSISALALRFLLPPDERLSTIIGPERFAKLKQLLMRHVSGMDEVILDRFKPWAAALLLDYPAAIDDGVVLDLRLEKAANAAGVPLHALESDEEQIGIFEALTHNEQLDLLDQTLKDYSEESEIIAELVEAYHGKDLRRIGRLDEKAQQLDNGGGELAQRLQRELVEDRNRRMLDRLQPYLRRGNAFVAVGALHLIGKNGLLAGLEKRGYTISQ